MTKTQSVLLLTTLALTLFSTGCRQGKPEKQPSADESAATAAQTTTAPTEEVAYEPAYPTDVSAEGLSDEDVAQQEFGHAHGGEEHSHGDGSHTHGEEEPHDDHDH